MPLERLRGLALTDEDGAVVGRASHTTTDMTLRESRYVHVVNNKSYLDYDTRSQRLGRRRKVPWRPGNASFFTGHATSTRVTLALTDDTTVRVTGKELARVLQHWQELGPQNRSIVLYSCDTGLPPQHGGLSVAQHVANRTGRLVHAPTTEVGTARDNAGRFQPILHKDADGNPGTWKVFTPEPAGTTLDDLARAAGHHQGPGPADLRARTRTLQLVRTLRGTLGTQVENTPQYPALLHGLAAVDTLRWNGEAGRPATGYTDGRMTPDLLSRITRDLLGLPASMTPGPAHYTAILSTADSTRTTNPATPQPHLHITTPTLPNQTRPTPQPTTPTAPTHATEPTSTTSTGRTTTPPSRPTTQPQRKARPLPPAPTLTKKPPFTSTPATEPTGTTNTGRTTTPPSRPSGLKGGTQDATADRKTIGQLKPARHRPGLDVLDVLGNGDCFFTSVLAGTARQHPTSPLRHMTVDQLRAAAAHWYATSQIRADLDALGMNPLETLIQDLDTPTLQTILGDVELPPLSHGQRAQIENGLARQVKRDALAGRTTNHEAARARLTDFQHTDLLRTHLTFELSLGGPEAHQHWNRLLNTAYPRWAADTTAPTLHEITTATMGDLVRQAINDVRLWRTPFFDHAIPAVANYLNMNVVVAQNDPTRDVHLLPNAQHTLYVHYNGTDHYSATTLATPQKARPLPTTPTNTPPFTNNPTPQPTGKTNTTTVTETGAGTTTAPKRVYFADDPGAEHTNTASAEGGAGTATEPPSRPTTQPGRKVRPLPPNLATTSQAPVVSRKGVIGSATAQRNNTEGAKDRPATTSRWRLPHTISEGPSQYGSTAADQLSHKDPFPSLINSDAPTEPDQDNEVSATRTRTDHRTPLAPRPSDVLFSHEGGRGVDALFESDRPHQGETGDPRTRQTEPSPADLTIARLLVSGQGPDDALQRMRAARLPQRGFLDKEDQWFYRQLAQSRDIWQQVDEVRAAQLVMAERRSRPDHDRVAAWNRLRNTPALAGIYTTAWDNASKAMRFVGTVDKHLGTGMSLVSNVRLDVAGGGGGSLLAELTAGPGVVVGEVLAQAAGALPVADPRGRSLPATLVSKEFQKSGTGPLGTAAIHWRKEVRRRTVHTPSPDDANPRHGATLSSLYPLLTHGNVNAVRLALAEATQFEHDLELRRRFAAGRPATDAHFGALI
ncbi:hypothetical protein ACFVFJ_49700, partial [Streptomyces sp. NPDC057717]